MRSNCTSEIFCHPEQECSLFGIRLVQHLVRLIKRIERLRKLKRVAGDMGRLARCYRSFDS